MSAIDSKAMYELLLNKCVLYIQQREAWRDAALESAKHVASLIYRNDRLTSLAQYRAKEVADLRRENFKLRNDAMRGAW